LQNVFLSHHVVVVPNIKYTMKCKYEESNTHTHTQEREREKHEISIRLVVVFEYESKFRILMRELYLRTK